MAAKYVKCPRCDLNYMLEGEEYCDVCKAELNKGPKLIFAVDEDEEPEPARKPWKKGFSTTIEDDPFDQPTPARRPAPAKKKKTSIPFDELFDVPEAASPAKSKPAKAAVPAVDFDLMPSSGRLNKKSEALLDADEEDELVIPVAPRKPAKKPAPIVAADPVIEQPIKTPAKQPAPVASDDDEDDLPIVVPPAPQAPAYEPPSIDCLNKPRETFAAFSALSTIYADLDFDRIEREDGGLHAYRFSGVLNGRPAAAFGCWDDDAKSGRTTLRIGTDASYAATADLMGNITPLPIIDGEVSFQVSGVPSSLLLTGLSGAGIIGVESSVPGDGDEPDLVVPAGAAAGRAPDIVLSRADQTTDLYAANPATVGRVWRGPSDLSARVWLSLDGDALKILAEVTDDTHSPVSPAEKLYEGDSIQFAIAAPGQRGCWEFGMALGPNGSVLAHCWLAPVGFAALPPPIWGSVARNAGITSYEVAVPLSALGLDEGQATRGFSFNFMVNENDGEGRDGWMEWSPGMATVKDYSEYPRVIFQ